MSSYDMRTADEQIVADSDYPYQDGATYRVTRVGATAPDIAGPDRGRWVYIAVAEDVPGGTDPKLHRHAAAHYSPARAREIAAALVEAADLAETREHEIAAGEASEGQ